MKVYITSEKLYVYPKMDIASNPITELFFGSVIDLGRQKIMNGRVIGYQIITNQGQKGYILEEFDYIKLGKQRLNQATTTIYQEPSLNSPIKNTVFLGFEFFVEGVIKTEDGIWIKIHDSLIQKGFVKSNIDTINLSIKNRGIISKPLISYSNLIPILILSITILLAMRIIWLIFLPAAPDLSEDGKKIFLFVRADYIFSGWPQEIYTTTKYNPYKTAIIQDITTYPYYTEESNLDKISDFISGFGIWCFIGGIIVALIGITKIKENDKRTLIFPLYGFFILLIGLNAYLTKNNLIIDNANNIALTVVIDKRIVEIPPMTYTNISLFSGRRHFVVKTKENKILYDNNLTFDGKNGQSALIFNLLRTNRYTKKTLNYILKNK
jgi:hypothetical protein